MNFHVHLEGSDAFGGAGNFEVHVASKIFGIHEVSKDVSFVNIFRRDFGAFRYIHHETHGYARNWALDWHAGVHQSHTGGTSGSHRGGAILRHDSVTLRIA